MKKYLRYIIGTLVILVLIISTPYFSGVLTEKYYRQSVSHLYDKLPVKVAIKTFNRNFFTSTVLLELQVDPSDNKKIPFVIPIEQNIIHGPFVVDLNYKQLPFSFALAHIHNKLGEPFKAKLTELFHNDMPFEMMTKLGFLGKGITYFSGAAMQQTTKTNHTIAWGGIEGKIVHSLDLQTLDGEITSPKLSLKDAEFEFNIANVSAKFKTIEKDSISIGTHSLNAGEITYQENKQLLLKLANIDINSTLGDESANSQKLRYALTAKIANSQILKQTFGENTYTVTAQSITAEFFKLLHANYNKKFALLDDLLRQLLGSEAKINMIIPKHFTLALISFGNFQLYGNSIIGKIDPRTKEQVLAEISNNIKEKFDSMVASKMLTTTKDDQLYVMGIEFNKVGKILLNGEPLQNPLEALKGFNQPTVPVVVPPAPEKAMVTPAPAEDKTTVPPAKAATK